MNLVSLALALASLLGGLWLYVFCRSEDTRVNVLLSSFLPAGTLHGWREVVQRILPVPDWLAWRLPGGLWVFAATLLARNLHLTLGRMRVLMASLPVITALAIEVCQAFHLTDGAYDPWDIATAVAAATLAMKLPGCDWPPQDLAGGWHWRGLVCAGSFTVLLLADVHR